VIVNDFHVVGITVTPDKTKTPLIVNPDTMLPLAFAAQSFKMVPRRRGQIAQFRSAVQLKQFPASDPLHRSKPPTRLPLVKPLGFRATKRPDHFFIVFRLAFNVKQYKQCSVPATDFGGSLTTLSR
jgi:hypothetical protein